MLYTEAVPGGSTLVCRCAVCVLMITLSWALTCHLCVAGSNRHNNGNPAGDGQAGAAGEGAEGQYTSPHSPTLITELHYQVT